MLPTQLKNNNTGQTWPNFILDDFRALGARQVAAQNRVMQRLTYARAVVYLLYFYGVKPYVSSTVQRPIEPPSKFLQALVLGEPQLIGMITSADRTPPADVLSITALLDQAGLPDHRLAFGAVGTRVARDPPHRSQQAGLRIRARITCSFGTAVILSAAKNLAVIAGEILRYAQDDDKENGQVISARILTH